MKKIDYRWTALILLLVAFFLQQGTRQVYGPLLGSIQASLGASDVQVGLGSTVFTLVYGLTITKPAAVLLALAMGMEVSVDVGFKTWMPSFLTENFGVSKASAGLNAVLWHYLGSAIGIVVGSRLGDRLVKRFPTIRFGIIGAGLVLGVPFIVLMSQAATCLTCCLAMLAFGVFRGVSLSQERRIRLCVSLRCC